MHKLVQDIYEVLSKDKEFNDSELQDFGQTLSRLLHSRLSEDRTGKQDLRLSRLGNRCDRKLWYEYHDPDGGEKLQPWVRLKFLFGDICEALVLYLAKLSGHSVTDEQREVEVQGVKGHIDGLIDGELYDVKSASPFSFSKFEAGLPEESDDFGYRGQLNGYMEALGKTEGNFLAIDKVHGHLTVTTIPKTIDSAKRVDHLRKVLAGPPPSRGFTDLEDGKSGNRKLGVNCSYCDRKGKCWPGLRTFIYSNGPRFLTVVNRVPDVPEVT